MLSKLNSIFKLRTKKSSKRFNKFYNQFKQMKIIRDLENNIETWGYNKLDEASRVAAIIKKKMNLNGIN